jgi:hypothetical protein
MTQWGDESLDRELRKVAYTHGPRLNAKPWGDDELLQWIESLPRSKRDKYMCAFHNLKTRPIDDEDHRITCFVKLEMHKTKPGFIKPRMIQYRTARFVVAVARYIKPIEHFMFTLKGTFSNDKFGDCAKGDDPVKRGAVIYKKALALNCPWVLSLDCSSFDAHIRRRAFALISKFLGRLATIAGARPMLLRYRDSLEWHCGTEFPGCFKMVGCHTQPTVA